MLASRTITNTCSKPYPNSKYRLFDKVMPSKAPASMKKPRPSSGSSVKARYKTLYTQELVNNSSYCLLTVTVFLKILSMPVKQLVYGKRLTILSKDRFFFDSCFEASKVDCVLGVNILTIIISFFLYLNGQLILNRHNKKNLPNC